jgi:hypothetical protein
MRSSDSVIWYRSTEEVKPSEISFSETAISK